MQDQMIGDGAYVRGKAGVNSVMSDGDAYVIWCHNMYVEPDHVRAGTTAQTTPWAGHPHLEWHRLRWNLPGEEADNTLFDPTRSFIIVSFNKNIGTREQNL